MGRLSLEQYLRRVQVEKQKQARPLKNVGTILGVQYRRGDDGGKDSESS